MSKIVFGCGAWKSVILFLKQIAILSHKLYNNRDKGEWFYEKRNL